MAENDQDIEMSDVNDAIGGIVASIEQTAQSNGASSSQLQSIGALKTGAKGVGANFCVYLVYLIDITLYLEKLLCGFRYKVQSIPSTSPNTAPSMPKWLISLTTP